MKDFYNDPTFLWLCDDLASIYSLLAHLVEVILFLFSYRIIHALCPETLLFDSNLEGICIFILKRYVVLQTSPYIDTAFFIFSCLQVACLTYVASTYLNCKTESKRWGTAHASIVPYQVSKWGRGLFLILWFLIALKLTNALLLVICSLSS